MEDVKWLLKKCGLPFLILLFAVIAGVICWGKLHTEERKVAEEVWEPPVEIENSEATTEADAETSTKSAYWFIPQSSDCLISDEEKEQLPLFIGKVSCRLIIWEFVGRKMECLKYRELR